MILNNNNIRIALGITFCLLLVSCSTAPVKTDPGPPAIRQATQEVDLSRNYPLSVYDPWETFNRGMYVFNARFDKYVYLPVVRGYRFITPEFVRTGVSNFFNNVGELTNLTNAILQLKAETALKTTGRLLLNSTLGVAGLFDIATPAGLPEREEDFGQTLGYWGVGDGPYIVLPIYGPSNLRDTGGLVVDTAVFYLIDPFNFDQNDDWGMVYSGVNAIDARYQKSFRYYATGSPFEYEWIRYLYRNGREIQNDK